MARKSVKGTEKELGGSFGAIGWIAECPVVVSWRILIGASPSGKKFADELVNSLALIKAFAHPAVEGLNPGAVEDLFLVAQEIGPLESPELRILRSLEELLNECFPFVFRGVGNEGTSFCSRR